MHIENPWENVKCIEARKLKCIIRLESQSQT